MWSTPAILRESEPCVGGRYRINGTSLWRRSRISIGTNTFLSSEVFLPVSARYSQAGRRNFSVFPSGDLPFLCVESGDVESANAALEGDPIGNAWKKVVNPMVEAVGYQACIDLFQMD